MNFGSLNLEREFGLLNSVVPIRLIASARIAANNSQIVFMDAENSEFYRLDLVVEPVMSIELFSHVTLQEGSGAVIMPRQVFKTSDRKFLDAVWRDLVCQAIELKAPKQNISPASIKQLIQVAVLAGIALLAIISMTTLAALNITNGVNQPRTQISSGLDSETLRQATEMLSQINNPSQDTVIPPEPLRVAPLIDPVASPELGATTSSDIGQNQYGISSVPSPDSWARTSEPHIPLPGGGDIKSVSDMQSFGLQP